MSIQEVCEGTDAVELTDTPEGLAAIQRPGCAATVWCRAPLPSFQSWLDALEPARLPNARLILRPEQMRDAATQICEIASTPACRERDQLIGDVAALAHVFAALTEASQLRLRFDVVTNNACRKFHSDTVTARLVCTYRGTGTQYGFSQNGEAPQPVFTVPTGAPIVMRGKLWPERPKSGFLHRSPPIEGTGETRLVLVLDPIPNPADMPDRKFLH